MKDGEIQGRGWAYFLYGVKVTLTGNDLTMKNTSSNEILYYEKELPKISGTSQYVVTSQILNIHLCSTETNDHVRVGFD